MPEAYLAPCPRCEHKNLIRGEWMPRSGLFTLKCQGCHERFDSEEASCTPTEWVPPPPRPKPKAEATPEELALDVDDYEPAPEDDDAEEYVPPDPMDLPGEREWPRMLTMCLAIAFLGLLAALGRGSHGGVTALLMGTLWSGASAAAWWDYRRRRSWARRLGAALAAFQTFGGVGGTAVGLYAAWPLVSGGRIPTAVHGLFLWPNWTGVFFQTCLLAALVVYSVRFLRALRSSPPVGLVDGRSPLGRLAGALMSAAGFVIIAAAFGAEFVGFPGSRALARHSRLIAGAGLPLLLGGLYLLALTRRRVAARALTISMALLLSLIWLGAHRYRARVSTALLVALQDLDVHCDEALPNRRRRRHRHAFLLEDLPPRLRERIRAVSERGASLYRADWRFRLFVRFYWRRRVTGEDPPEAAAINFCHRRLRWHVRRQLERHAHRRPDPP